MVRDIRDRAWRSKYSNGNIEHRAASHSPSPLMRAIPATRYRRAQILSEIAASVDITTHSLESS